MPHPTSTAARHALDAVTATRERRPAIAVIVVRLTDVGGIGVHIASRALSEAGEGPVVVTRTVRDLATGTDLAFTPLGSAGLRVVPGQWELFAVSLA